MSISVRGPTIWRCIKFPQTNSAPIAIRQGQLLDHFGVILENPAAVDRMFRDLTEDRLSSEARSSNSRSNIGTAATPFILPILTAT